MDRCRMFLFTKSATFKCWIVDTHSKEQESKTARCSKNNEVVIKRFLTIHGPAMMQWSQIWGNSVRSRNRKCDEKLRDAILKPKRVLNRLAPEGHQRQQAD